MTVWKVNSEPQISLWQTHPSPLPGGQYPNTCRRLATAAKQKARSSRADLLRRVHDEPTRQQPPWETGQPKWRPGRSSVCVYREPDCSAESRNEAAVRLQERRWRQESLPGGERWVCRSALISDGLLKDIDQVSTRKKKHRNRDLTIK